MDNMPQNAKCGVPERAFRTQEGLWLFLAPEASQSSLMLHAKRIRCVSHSDKICEKSEPFSSREKKDPGRKPNLPPQTWWPEPFLLQPKKDPELGRSIFWWFHPAF